MEDMQEFGTVERAMMTRAASRGVPINGSLELLPLCNMNCDMCYVRLSKAEMDAAGTMRTAEEWLAVGREMAEAGVLFLLLTGGEPLLHPQFREIYLGLKAMGMILTVNTNATLIDEAWADFFAQNKPRRINITIYGGCGESYERLCHYEKGFERAVRGVKLLRDRGVDVRAGYSVTPENRGDMERIFALAKELDVPLISDTYMQPAVRERSKPFNHHSRLFPEEAAAANIMKLRLDKGEDAFRQYAAEVLRQVASFVPGEENPCKAGCMAGKCSFNVDWLGRMKPCVLAPEPAANVFELGFLEAWKRIREGFGAIRYCSRCSVCALRPLCPVCPVAVYHETGNYMDVPDYLCRYAAELHRLLADTPEECHE